MRAGHYRIPPVFQHVNNRDAWPTHTLLDKANLIIETVNALAEGRTHNVKSFIFNRTPFHSHGELSAATEEALARILLVLTSISGEWQCEPPPLIRGTWASQILSLWTLQAPLGNQQKRGGLSN